MDKKICLPGDCLGGCEEFIPGDNTYVENENIYAALIGHVVEDKRKISVIGSQNELSTIKNGTRLYCSAILVKDSRAVMQCSPIQEKGKRFLEPIIATLSIQNVKRDYVKNLHDEIKVGDILETIVVMNKPEIEVSIANEEYGIICAFCSKCRIRMGLNENRLKCENCGIVEKRKISKNY